MTGEHITASACRSCGLCCVSPFDDDAFCDVTEKDVRRLDRRFRRHVVTPEPFEPALATRSREVRRGPLKGVHVCACVALRGSPAHQVSCAIYKRRPTVCREAKPGDQMCRAIRNALADYFTDRNDDALLQPSTRP